MRTTTTRIRSEFRGYRRRVLLGAAACGAAALAGCDLFDEPKPPPGPDPLEPVRAQAQALADRYAAAIAAAPDLATRLQPLRDAHLAHVAELTKVIGTPPPSPSPSAPPSAAAPTDPAALLASLRADEEAGRRDAETACLAAPGHRAALLGSIAACRATHVEVLT